jgi:general secretion pathway protein G
MRGAARRFGPDRVQAGFTLIELMIAIAILAILAGIGVPQYVSALRTAKVGKARQELVTISHAIDGYAATHGGLLPLTLYQVGFGGRRDPWGVRYCYLNYADGTGDGLDWAIRAGLVDPAALKASSSGGGAGGEALRFGSFVPASFRRRLPQDPFAGPVAVEGGDASVQSLAQAVTAALPRPSDSNESAELAGSLRRAGTFAFFAGVAGETTRRRDRYMFPLNTDYDLFSLGADGATAVAIGNPVSLDDVIRAQNGGYFGLAGDY